MPDPLSLTDRLALQRTRLANERTFLTYVRTSLAMVGFGLVLLQLHPVRAGWLGYAALLAAGVVMLIGFFRFRQRRREIESC
ncbi:YidH family protein [Hymenobacter ruber]